MQKIIKRCCWCSPRHLMDDLGDPLPGNASRPGVLYSDGACRKAEKILNKELDGGKKGLTKHL